MDKHSRDAFESLIAAKEAHGKAHDKLDEFKGQIAVGDAYAAMVKEHKAFEILEKAQKQWDYLEKSHSAKDEIKSIGGKALTGTAKQKIWGEKIRSEKFARMQDEAKKYALKGSAEAKTAKFWIDNRAHTGEAIGDYLLAKRDLAAAAKEYEAAGVEDAYAEVAEKYNNLKIV